MSNLSEWYHPPFAKCSCWNLGSNPWFLSPIPTSNQPVSLVVSTHEYILNILLDSLPPWSKQPSAPFWTTTVVSNSPPCYPFTSSPHTSENDLGKTWLRSPLETQEPHCDHIQISLMFCQTIWPLISFLPPPQPALALLTHLGLAHFILRFLYLLLFLPGMLFFPEFLLFYSRVCVYYLFRQAWNDSPITMPCFIFLSTLNTETIYIYTHTLYIYMHVYIHICIYYIHFYVLIYII